MCENINVQLAEKVVNSVGWIALSGGPLENKQLLLIVIAISYTGVLVAPSFSLRIAVIGLVIVFPT